MLSCFFRRSHPEHSQRSLLRALATPRGPKLPDYVIVPHNNNDKKTKAMDPIVVLDDNDGKEENWPYDEANDLGGSLKAMSHNGKKARRAKSTASAVVEQLPFVAPHSFIAAKLRVTMIDWTHKIFVIDLLDPAHCRYIVDLARDTAEWGKHYEHTHSDCPACDIPSLRSLLAVVHSHVLEVLQAVYGTTRVHDLYERSWKEPHLLRYTANHDHSLSSSTGVRLHHDGSDITWSLMLSSEQDYDGGGTYFKALNQTLKLKIGQVLVHPGNLLHSGIGITRGERFLAISFLDGFDTGVQEVASVQPYRILHT